MASSRMKKFKLTLQFLLMTPLLLVLVVFLMGGGHGYFEPAIFLFPWGMIGVIFFDRITFPFILLALMQYPAYGLALDKNRVKGNQGKIMVVILLVHASLIALIMALKSDLWN